MKLLQVVIEIVNVGQSMKAFVDTGAELTAVRRSNLWDQFKMDPWKEPPFRCADHFHLTPLGLAACTVQCGFNVVELCRVAVLESPPMPPYWEWIGCSRPGHHWYQGEGAW